MYEHGIKTTLALKLPWYFYLLLLLPSLVSLLLGSTVQLENTCSRILKVTGQIWERQKRISINTNHSHYQKIGCEAGQCKTFSPEGIFIMTPSLEGLQTKAKEVPSPHEVRLVLLNTNSVFQCLREIGNRCLQSTTSFPKTSFFYKSKMWK